MARADIQYVCQSCGASYTKWSGRCEACASWNTILEEIDIPSIGTGANASSSASVRRRSGKIDFTSLAGHSEAAPRQPTGLAELDRALGGGLVRGSAVLIGGDPGVGKSTLLLQAAASMARNGGAVAYISGEEAVAQIQDRARRLGVAESGVSLAAETDLNLILEGLKHLKPDLAIIDSIQTVWSEAAGAAPGTVVQVRACAHELVRFAKKSGTSVILVGHVTKDGQIAGPRVMEHMVDATLYFEGDRGHQFRILRAVKNRFGPVDEIGVFEMAEAGLRETPNPSALFLDSTGLRASGAAVFAAVEGSRPMLVEIQALTAQLNPGTPRRTVVGWDNARLSMILAVLETRCGLSFAGRDVYLSVSGGLKLTEPAADLAVAAALASAAFDKPLPKDMVAFGEIALSGAIRPAGRADVRLKEAAKLGFRRALAARAVEGAEPYVPTRRASGRNTPEQGRLPGATKEDKPFEVTRLTSVQEAIDLIRQGFEGD